MTVQRKCIHCALYRTNGNKCPIFPNDMSMERGCPHYADRIDACSLCSQHIIGTKTYRERNDEFIQLCERCEAALSQNQCQVCGNGSYCAFQQDQSCTLPPYITRQERQGNAVVQFQQKNPERVKQTCGNCSCFCHEFCFREIGGCDNFTWQKIR